MIQVTPTEFFYWFISMLILVACHALILNNKLNIEDWIYAFLGFAVCSSIVIVSALKLPSENYFILMGCTILLDVVVGTFIPGQKVKEKVRR